MCPPRGHGVLWRVAGGVGLYCPGGVGVVRQSAHIITSGGCTVLQRGVQGYLGKSAVQERSARYTVEKRRVKKYSEISPHL